MDVKGFQEHPLFLKVGVRGGGYHLATVTGKVFIPFYTWSLYTLKPQKLTGNGH